MHTPSEASTHAESIHDRLSVVQQELASHRSRQSNRAKASLQMCTDALASYKDQFHDIEERIALQASDHRAELNLLENFIREALFKVEQRLTGDADMQFDIFNENTQVVEEKVKQLEQIVFQGDGVESEEEQIGLVRNEMNAAVEAARQLAEDEEEQAKRDLAELVEPSHLKIRNLLDMIESEMRATERLTEDTRAQLLQLAAPPGGGNSRMEAREREIARGLKELKNGLVELRQEREMTFATLYDAMTQLSQEMIKKAEENR